jgi:hypothetical protein
LGSQPQRCPRLAERNRIERSPHDGATVFETVWGADPSTLRELAGSRRCRSPCLAAPSVFKAEPGAVPVDCPCGGRLWSRSTSPLRLQPASNRCRRACPVNRPRIGTPGRIRIDNLRVLSAAPLPVGLPGRIGTRGRIRTDTAEALDLVPPADWATRAWCGSSDSNRDLDEV